MTTPEPTPMTPELDLLKLVKEQASVNGPLYLSSSSTKLLANYITTLEALAAQVGEERAARKRWENADIDEIPERHKLKAIWHGTLMNLHAAYAAYEQGRGSRAQPPAEGG